MKKLCIFLLAITLLALCGESYACTSAIVVASKSSEGVPMLWKHRDSNGWNCRVAYVEGGKYAYTALVSLNGKNTYCGINEKGFAVMNNATKNMPIPDKSIKSASAVGLMGKILRSFATVDEFEAWLKSTNGKRSYGTMFAVGDITGAVAYFEVAQEFYKRYDAVDNGGIDMRSNFCFAGDKKKRGPSVPRYHIAKNQLNGKESVTPHELIEFSRNYLNKGGVCALDNPKTEEIDSHTIARYTSAASAVMVCDARNPRMLVAVGHPSATMAVPVYVNAKRAIPECVSGRAMLDLGNEFRAKAYTKPQNGKYQLNKAVVSKVVAVNTKCEMPAEMPKEIDKFNAKVDKLFAKHAKKVRKAMR